MIGPRTVSLLVFSSLLAPGFAAAQHPGVDGPPRFLERPVTFPAADLGIRCVTIPRRERFIVPPLSVACRVIGHVGLLTLDGVEWSYDLHERTLVYHFPGRAKTDTVIDQELFVFTRQGPDAPEVTAVALFRGDYAGPPEIDLRMVNHPEGVLLAGRICHSDLGGCWQEFQVRRDGVWRRWEHPHWLVLRALRQEGAIQESMAEFLADTSMDPLTLTGFSRIGKPWEQPCCRNTRVEFTVAMGDGAFRLVGVRIVTNPQ